MNRLQPWTPASWLSLSWCRKYDIRQNWFWKKNQYHIREMGNPDRHLMHCETTSTIVGPMAFKRLVTLTTSIRTLQLHLGNGLALGTGMPAWLRSAHLVENGNRLGTLVIASDKVTYHTEQPSSPLLEWKLDLPLLKYTGPDQSLGYGTIYLANSATVLGQMLVPRMNSITPKIEYKCPLFRNLVNPEKLSTELEQGLLGFLALTVFCLDIATQWHISMTENRPGTMPG